MTEPSDTPRTNTLLDTFPKSAQAHEYMPSFYELVKHARQLERDLAAARAEVVRLTSAYARLSEQMIDANAELAALKQAVRLMFFAIGRIKLQGGSTHEAGEAQDHLRVLAGMEPEVASFQASPNATLDDLRAALAQEKK